MFSKIQNLRGHASVIPLKKFDILKGKSLHDRAILSEHLKNSAKNIVIMLVVIKIHEVFVL